MRFTPLLSAVSILSFIDVVRTQDRDIGTVKKAFQDANIPEDLGINFDPTFFLEVSFPQADGSHLVIHAGEHVPRNATAGPPTFSIASTEPTVHKMRFNNFVVAAVDPDAPTPQDPTSAQIRHFLGGNFHPVGPFQSFEVGVLRNTTAAISEFRQPTPPAGSDPHRYIFLLFAQPAGFNDQTIITPATPVQLFDIAAFAEEVGLGDPLGGTFMLVAPDPATAEIVEAEDVSLFRKFWA